MSKNDDALRCAEYLQSMVQTYPQMSEEEPGGYCSQADEAMDAAVGFIRRLVAENEAKDALLRQALEAMEINHYAVHDQATNEDCKLYGEMIDAIRQHLEGK